MHSGCWAEAAEPIRAISAAAECSSVVLQAAADPAEAEELSTPADPAFCLCARLRPVAEPTESKEPLGDGSILTSSGTACCSHDKAASGCCVRPDCVRLVSLVSAAVTALEHEDSDGTCVWSSLLHTRKRFKIPAYSAARKCWNFMSNRSVSLGKRVLMTRRARSNRPAAETTVLLGSLQGHVVG